MSPAVIRWMILAQLTLAGGFASLHGQGNSNSGISIRSSASRILLGEPFTLEVQANFSHAARPGAWVPLPDTIAHFELLEPVKHDSLIQEGRMTHHWTYRLTSFDSGRWAIPVVSVVLEKKTYRSDTLSVMVNTVPIEGNAYRDIHEIIEVEEKEVDWKRWAAIALAVLVVCVGLWYYLRKRRKPAVVPPAMESKLSPLDQALQALRALREANLAGKGEIKAHYSTLTDTLRVFLARKLNLPVKSDTTDAILMRLKQTGVNRDALSALAGLLRVSDAVKFARYIPPTGEPEQAVDAMQSLIQELNQQNLSA